MFFKKAGKPAEQQPTLEDFDGFVPMCATEIPPEARDLFKKENEAPEQTVRRRLSHPHA